jgi:hypothetical protein
MPNCNPELFEFPSFDRRKIEGSFPGGAVSSDGGIMALREADRRQNDPRLNITGGTRSRIPATSRPSVIFCTQSTAVCAMRSMSC